MAPEWPLAIEILCPVLSVHIVDGWEEGCEVSLATLRYEGLGHTIGLWARDETVLNAWFLEKPANRIVVNGPTSEGAVGYSTSLMPSMSLGCGPQAGNITSDNITARHLINIKRVAMRRRDWEGRYAKDHERAGVLSGDTAPRGSGLPGDPSMTGVGRGTARASEDTPVMSNWRGNPTVEFKPAPRSTPATPASSGARHALQGQGRHEVRSDFSAYFCAPCGPHRRAVHERRGVPATVRAAARRTPIERRRPRRHVALAFSEIQGILANAGERLPARAVPGLPAARNSDWGLQGLIRHPIPDIPRDHDRPMAQKS